LKYSLFLVRITSSSSVLPPHPPFGVLPLRQGKKEVARSDGGVFLRIKYLLTHPLVFIEFIY